MDCKSNNCKDFVELIQLILDEEATPAQEETFKKHYSGCNHCAEHYNIEASTMEFIRKKLCREQVPANLADQIRAKISQLK